MIIYQFIYIWPTSLTEYVTEEVTWRVMPRGLRLKFSGLNTPGMTPLPSPTPPTLKTLVFVFNKVQFIIDRDLSKQFWFQVDGSRN